MSGAKIHDVPETTAITERLLRDGTPLRYQLTVLQQPQRARACGMGAKSHADRRPVDPPPVVELKIFAGEEKTDVTFAHNSNFFLFTTLELARPTAQARGMPAVPASNPPVLTGVPVSGMAYLDRPSPAGYFIFPDLSVRHEGRYRLRFSLYEESKDQADMVTPAREGEPREFAVHRIEVKSKPFTVFSAKKFPGLAESTALSRIVAEQGCRVRIRRDVRMRRRGDGRRDADGEFDETAQLRAVRARESPEPYEHETRNKSQPQARPQPTPSQPHHMQPSESVDRKRSDSNASVMSMTDAPAQQRYDDRYAPRQEGNHYGPPPAPVHHHMSYSGQPTVSGPPPSVHPPQVYNHQTIPSRYAAPPAQYSQPPQQSSHAAPVARPPVQNGHYAPQKPSYHRENSDTSMMQPNDHRRPSEHQPPMAHSRREHEQQSYRAAQPSQQYRPAPPTAGPQYQPQHYAPAPYQPAPQPQQYHQTAPQSSSLPALNKPLLKLPPLTSFRSSEPSAPTPSSAPLPSPSSYAPSNGHAQHRQAPPPPPPSSVHSGPSYHQTYAPYTPSAVYVPPKPAHAPPPTVGEAPRGTKREWGRVFDDSHLSGPLHDGKRPDTVSGGSGYGEDPQDDEDEFDLAKLKMTYRRAGGEEIVRRLPLE